jgi:hypothetical protein
MFLAVPDAVADGAIFEAVVKAWLLPAAARVKSEEVMATWAMMFEFTVAYGSLNA